MGDRRDRGIGTGRERGISLLFRGGAEALISVGSMVLGFILWECG